MARVITLDGLRVKSLRGRARKSCRKIHKSPMRSMNGEEMYRCIVDDGGDVLGGEALTVGQLGEAAPSIVPPPPPAVPREQLDLPGMSPARRRAERRWKMPKRAPGRPVGSYGARRGGYVDTRTGMRLNVVAKQPKMAVACRLGDPDGVYWDYNNNPNSKFYGQFRCRCKTVSFKKGKSNTNYVPSHYCEEHGLNKSPAESERIRTDLKAQINALKGKKR